MPDLTPLQQVRLYTDEPDATNGVTDDLVNQLLAAGDVHSATAVVWRVKAGKLAKKVNTSTAQTRLELKSQFEHAMQMYALYADLSGEDAGSGVWESITMAAVEGLWPADEPQSMDAYWPGFGKQWPSGVV